mgnify:CR=1 FL=1
MDFWTIFRIIHVAAGIISFVAGPLAMGFRKGGRSHEMAGNVFFWGMAVTTGTGFIISLVNGGVFLLMISVFSFYSVLFGRRALEWYRGGMPGWKDRLYQIITIIFCLGLIALGFYVLFTNPQNQLWVIAFFFGILGTIMIGSDIRKTQKPRSRIFWLRAHISGMIGGYIAATTAFSANTLNMLPGLVQWLWPTLIFVPVIIAYQRKYTPKPARV